MLVDPPRQSQARGKKQNGHHPVLQEAAKSALISGTESVQAAVEGTEQAAFFCVAMTQEDSGESRRESKRVESGNGNGKRDGQRELPKEYAGSAREKSYRNKYRNQNQGCGHDGAGNFFHGRGGGIVRLRNSLGDVALHVLDYHDCIVHHQTGGQREAKQGERVNRKAQHFDKREGADERDRNGDGRNQSASPVLQENKNYQDDQKNGLEQGVQDVTDGFVDDGGGVERHGILHAGRKVLGYAR